MMARAVKSKSDLLDLLRGRAAELNATRENIDMVAGFPDRYSGKLLGPSQVRAPVSESLWPLLGALGLRLVIEEDLAAAEFLRKQYRRKRRLFSKPPLTVKPMDYV